MKKFKSKKGFTLIEVVTVVGIIAVLCAITIIPISKMGSSLDKQQENNYAKDIYIAVQDELASLRTDGSIRKLADKGFTSVYASTGESPELCNEVKELLTGDYADLQAELIGEDLKREYVYVMGTGDNAISSVLPAGKIDSTIFSDSIEVAVIFNKMSGDVLFVKYGENGRYSGKVVNQADKIKIDTEKITPVIKIVQDEECYVSVTVQVPQEMRSADGLIKFRDGLKYDITMKDTGSDTEYNYEYLGSGEYDTFTSSYHSGSCEAKWSVDSMIEGLHFEDKFKNQDELAPILSGNDIKVIVKCSYVGEGKKIDIDKAAVEKTFNPLFHSVTAENGKYSLHIANGRELQNLNNIDDSYVGKVENVILENNIEWGKTVTYYSFWFNENIEKIQKKHPGKNSSVLLTEYEPMWNQFKPLEEKLFAADADKPVFDGNGKKIINLHIRPVIDDSADSENKRSGMFRTLYSEVKDLTFVDPVVMGTDDTGVLAGYAERAIVSGCGVSINSYNLRVIDAIDLSSVFYGATLVDPNVENKSVGLLLGCAENCSVSNSNIKIDYEMESSSEGIYVPVTSSNFGLIAGTADNCTVSGGTITAGINGGNTCGFTDRTKLSGAAGAAIGTVNGGTVSGITVDGTMSGITAGSLGGIVGSLKNAIIDSCEFNGTIDGGLSDSLGGLAGKVEAQKNANAVVSSSVGGKLKEISANCFGGAVGSAYGGKYIDISVSTDEMSVTSVWYIGETGDNKLEKDYGVYNCPTGLGYAGKFVGFISTGNFSNCSALCTSSGKRDDAHNYKNMQFVGAVKCTKTILSNKELYASSKPQGTSGIAAIMESENYYKATDGSNMYFSSAVDIDNYNYTDIDLTNCYYYNSAADKKKQAIETENKYYYYSKTVDGKTKTLADTMENQDYYLLAKPDGAGDYDIMVCKKKEIEGSTLKNDWKNDKYYIYASDATNNYYLFDSEDEEEKSDVSYYFDPKDTTRAYTVTGSFPSYDQNDGMAELSRYYSIDNVGRKLFRYYVDTIKCKRDLGINLDGALTEQEYNILLKHSWHWVQHGKTTEDDGQVYYTGNLIYDGYGDSNYGWSDAYLFLRVDDIAVGGILTPSQQVPVVLPYSDSLSRFFDSGTCRSTNSAFFLYARKVNGSMLIYREKKLSFGDRVATFDFGTDTTSVKWAKNNNYSAITTGVNIVATSGMVDAYSFSHKKTEETKHLV